MEYTVKQLANLAGVSSRTLRYYDEIGLLKPKRMNSASYRIYGQKEIDRLQHILFYRELDVGLDAIMTLMNEDTFHVEKALLQHKAHLEQKRDRLNQLLQTLEQTIASTKGGEPMSNQSKFAAFKRQQIKENERLYGKEIRKEYGEDTVNETNNHLLQLTESDYLQRQKIENALTERLREASNSLVITKETEQEITQLHKKWIMFSWSTYSEQAHIGLADLYVEDERFKRYYDAIASNAASILRTAIRNTLAP
ncbi:MerR family transcriptional regulator [Shouchella miscanthi]|uniref:MerR family transcriptional regulator n=1 Tax=Shouchella miscanthi TaxID=2598861 RepID=UPI0011A3DC79|nr:MerR family transcriptional regulator [Shouchella miscanthi]